VLDPKQRSHLSALASKSTIIAHLGKAGATEAFAEQLARLLERHELVKLRFIDFKDEKKDISAKLSASTSSELVRIIGNTAIFYKRNPDPEKRLIDLP
jgi:RNA-binding protein